MSDKKRVAVYVDGFNLYHGIENLSKPHLQWLNLKSLTEKYILPQAEVIEKVYYFSAVATFMKNEIVQRHKIYIEALQTTGVEFVEGNFKDKLLTYKNQHLELKWKKHEEKETDVNISIYMLRDAIRKRFDKFILITNDTDIVPAIKMARSENRGLHFKLLTPPTYRTHDSLAQAVKPITPSRLSLEEIQANLLPEKIVKTNGKIITMPRSYASIKSLESHKN